MSNERGNSRSPDGKREERDKPHSNSTNDNTKQDVNQRHSRSPASYSRSPRRSRSPRSPRSPRRSRSPRSPSRSPRSPRSRYRRSRSASRGSNSPRKSSNKGDQLYIANLSSHTREDELRDGFSKYGKVIECSIVKDPKTNETRGFGFVKMSSVEEAQQCISSLNKTELDGRIISVEE
eukprot:TRINITY_DN121_c0_g2_i1.p1 TRINITY_DN121_c0_g2~~TRINITY_DN121_c0_g2_i1.p1  ORF type:complete len:191 (-),score=30.12 TRINITY_DN121_c0_g2_i1:84-617(-)